MPDSRVDTIIDRLRNARSTGIDHRGEVRVPLAVAVAAVHAAAGLGSPDERLREALALIAQHARLDLTERGIAEAERYAGIAEDALAAADREAPDEAEVR